MNSLTVLSKVSFYRIRAACAEVGAACSASILSARATRKARATTTLDDSEVVQEGLSPTTLHSGFRGSEK